MKKNNLDIIKNKLNLKKPTDIENIKENNIENLNFDKKINNLNDDDFDDFYDGLEEENNNFFLNIK